MFVEMLKPFTNFGPNEKCHCGSGRKYKMCHMRDDDVVKINMNRREPEKPEVMAVADDVVITKETSGNETKV